MLPAPTWWQGTRSSSNCELIIRILIRRFSISWQRRDVNEGADIIMIKPGMPYLDIIAEAARIAPDHPLAVYQVSGEFAMIVAGAKAGVYDLKIMAFESIQAFLRAGRCPPAQFVFIPLTCPAGCTLVLSYFTPEFLDWLDE